MESEPRRTLQTRSTALAPKITFSYIILNFVQSKYTTTNFLKLHFKGKIPNKGQVSVFCFILFRFQFHKSQSISYEGSMVKFL